MKNNLFYKKRNITFDFSGTDESIRKTLRNYTADKALMRINAETAAIFQNSDNKNDLPGSRYLSFPYHESNGKTQIQKVIVNGWSLHNLAYHVTLHTDDYRGKLIESEQELAMLVNLAEAHFQRWEHIFLDKLHTRPDGNTDLKFYLWGFAGEQFKYQELAKTFDNSSRELYILFVCRNRINSDIDIESIVKTETGIDWQNIVSFLFLAWFQSTHSPFLLDIKDKLTWDESFPYEEYESLLKRYTSTYEMIRKDEFNLGRQQLLIKPFVKTHKRDIISVNVFLNLFLFEHSILWIVRDYYNKTKDRKFTSEFGDYFEEYFRELLSTYLDENSFSKIHETDTEKADWKVEIGEFQFLIEQKSSILSILAKQQESNIDIMKKYCINNIVKALHQLRKTEEDFSDGKYIKIVILYEDYLNAESLDEVFELPECDVENDRLYWLMTIDEMEKLLHYYSEDANGFFDLIRLKNKLEYNKSNDGRSIEFLLNNLGITENGYLKKDEIKYYSDLVRNKLREHMPKH